MPNAINSVKFLQNLNYLFRILAILKNININTLSTYFYSNVRLN